ncbi:MAG: ComF family protein [Bacillota bacterium]|jgi:competence protein ComFC
MSIFDNWAHSLRQLLFPITICLACGQKINGIGICPACSEKIRQAKRCPSCAAFLSEASDICPLCCGNKKLPFTKAIAALPYEGILRRFLHNYKYHNQTWLARPLSHILSIALSDYDWTDFILVPVPLSPTREKERGYNQSELISSLVAKNLGLPCYKKALKRDIDTPPLYSLNCQERYSLLTGAFSCGEQSVAGKKILLIDDIFTTGATSIVCCNTLLRAEAVQIVVATIASTKA